MAEYKRYETLEFTDDFMFCKVLESHPELCEELTSLILGRQVRIKCDVKKQKVIEIIADGRGIRMDIYFEGDDQTIYNLEMQNSNEGNLPKRTRYYHSLADLDLLERGATFDNLPQAFVVFLCKFDLFEQGLYRYTFQNRCDERPELALKDGAISVFINAASAAETASEDMKALLNYLMTGEATSDLTRRIQKYVVAGRTTGAWKMIYLKQHSRDETIRKEAEATGIAIGEERGIAIGEERGIAIGEERGEREQAIRIAKSMKEDGIPEDVISKYTGLSLEEIEAL